MILSTFLYVAVTHLLQKCYAMGVKLKNKFFNRKFVLEHHKLGMRKERAQE